MEISKFNIGDTANKTGILNNYLDHISLFENLKEFLPEHAKVLELNASSEFSREAMSSYYNMTLSVDSQQKMKEFQNRNLPYEIIQMLPAEINSNTKYDGIFSNKGMVGLNKRELQASILGQLRALKPNGIICHTFWEGIGIEHDLDRKCYFHQIDDLKHRYMGRFKILTLTTYSDTTKSDSLLLIGRKL